MEKIDKVISKAVPLRRANVDTDQIIPSEWLKNVEKTGFVDGLFSQWREDSSFVLNDPRYKGARILVALENFGCGSSREHAVWALTEWGFRVILAPSFADIFRNNALKNGLATIALETNYIHTLLDIVENDPETVVSVSLPDQTVSVNDLTFNFQMDEFVKERYVKGLDDITITLELEGKINQFEATRPLFFPSARLN